MDKRYLDMLRWIAAISVIIVHVAMNSNNELLHYLFIWGVPIFVMISGALFLNPEKEISIKDMCFKYTMNIIITIIFGGSLLNLIDSMILGEKISLALLYKSIIDSFIGKTPQHFWYLYMIIGIYLTIPFVKTFLKSANDQTIKYVLVISLLAISIVPFIKQLLNVNIVFYLPITSIYFVYLLLGYVLQYKNYFSLNKIQLSFIASLMLALIFISKYNGWDVGVSYNSPIIAIFASSLFLLFKGMSNDIMTKYKNLCFMIYLVHPTVITLFGNDNIFYTIAVVIVISICISLLINKLTYLVKNQYRMMKSNDLDSKVTEATS